MKLLVCLLAFILAHAAIPSLGLDSDDYEIVALNLHNNHRTLHGAPALVLDEDLQIAAQGYATYLARNNLPLNPKRGLKYGQNFFELNARGGALPNDTELVESAVDSWYSKAKSHDYINPTLSTFTQMVWRSTKLFGIGVGKNGDRAVIVAMYDPPGNVMGYFHENVLSNSFHSDSASGVLPPRRFTSTTTTPISFTTTKVTTTETPTRYTTRKVPESPSDKGPVAELSERDIQKVALDLHNSFRSKHGSPDLVLDDELSLDAQRYAESLASGKPKSRTSTGQNIFRFSGFTLSSQEAVEKAIGQWYAAKSVYNWNNPLSSPNDANLFSQLVWKNSTKLGIGYVTKKNGNVVVAFYAPAGNILSLEEYTKNVPRELN
ncbi:unnamed protein product [Allacma fusca]|uniref:SCP domain-containing protein n=1 Tax=Allacma fusca TaxID=39272 RepID=A0A8J2K8T9_9HEXA|nr:unnamed protein product [Allacma fusca]